MPTLRSAANMELLRKWLLPLAILSLPWQTRYILATIPTPEAGYQTEWGIYAVYASWILIILAWLVSRRSLSRTTLRDGSDKLIWVALVLFFIPVALQFTVYSLQFFAQIFVLLLLADAIRHEQWSRARLATWFVASLVPHALLAVWQYDSQYVFASKWLGMAAQDPSLVGVSVIEHAGERILRAYGGFPHPNIAGIWFAFGLAASLWLIRHAETKWASLLGWFMCVILPFALVLTFSRSAFLSAAILLCATCYMIFARHPMDMFLLRPFIWSMICFLIISLLVWPLLVSRGSSDNRLETKSVSERVSVWTGIWPAIGESPLIGHGIGSAGLSPQPPHAVPLIILFELGLFGLIGSGLLAWTVWKKSDMLGRIPLVALVPPFLLDHYFYSIWAGISLLILAIFYSCTVDKNLKLG